MNCRSLWNLTHQSYASFGIAVGFGIGHFDKLRRKLPDISLICSLDAAGVKHNHGMHHGNCLSLLNHSCAFLVGVFFGLSKPDNDLMCASPTPVPRC